MNISQAIKRLQALENQHGNMDLITLQRDWADSEDVYAEDDLVIDVIEHNGKEVVAAMPKPYWEQIAPKGINYDSK
jgi:hypothetical protein